MINLEQIRAKETKGIYVCINKEINSLIYFNCRQILEKISKNKFKKIKILHKILSTIIQISLKEK